MRIRIILGTSMIVLAAALAAHALDGRNGYDAAELFVWGDAREVIEYETGFDGGEFGDLPKSMISLDRLSSGHIEANAQGDLFLLVVGNDGVGLDSPQMEYSSLLRYDGSSLVHVLQAAWDHDTYRDGSNMPSGSKLLALTVSPVTHGLLTAGDPIVSRGTRDVVTQAITMELLSVDPESRATTVIHTWTGDDGPYYMAVDASGTIHVLMYSRAIHQLTWNGQAGAYDESVLATSVTPGHLFRMGPDGALYTGDGNQPWGYYVNSRRDLLRIDPSSGAWSVFAQVPGRLRLCDMVFDSEGTAWIGLVDSKSKDYVTEVVPGALVSTRDAIATGLYPPKSLAAGPDGTLFVHGAPMEGLGVGRADYPHDAIHLLTPGSNDGGGKPPKKK